MKRFYKAAAAGPHESGHGVHLDGKPIRTPGKRPFAVPSPGLAAAIAAEWAAQGDEIRPAAMPLMKLASTAIDRVADHMDGVAAEALRYAGSDLLCYRASEPPALVERETATWQPLLDWAMLRFDAPLQITDGILPIEQPDASLGALGLVLGGMDALTLTAVADLTAACGSLVLALAIWDGRLGATETFEVATLDERFQNETWGEDAEAIAKRADLARDIEAAARFLALLRDG